MPRLQISYRYKSVALLRRCCREGRQRLESSSLFPLGGVADDAVWYFFAAVKFIHKEGTL